MSRYTDDEIEITTPLTLFMKKRVEEMRTDPRKNGDLRQLRPDWRGQRFSVAYHTLLNDKAACSVSPHGPHDQFLVKSVLSEAQSHLDHRHLYVQPFR